MIWGYPYFWKHPYALNKPLKAHLRLEALIWNTSGGTDLEWLSSPMTHPHPVPLPKKAAKFEGHKTGKSSVDIYIYYVTFPPAKRTSSMAKQKTLLGGVAVWNLFLFANPKPWGKDQYLTCAYFSAGWRKTGKWWYPSCLSLPVEALSKGIWWIWMFPKIGVYTTKNGWFISWNTLLEWDDLGGYPTPILGSTPIWTQ